MCIRSSRLSRLACTSVCSQVAIFFLISPLYSASSFTFGAGPKRNLSTNTPVGAPVSLLALGPLIPGRHPRLVCQRAAAVAEPGAAGLHTRPPASATDDVTSLFPTIKCSPRRSGACVVCMLWHFEAVYSGVGALRGAVYTAEG